MFPPSSVFLWFVLFTGCLALLEKDIVTFKPQRGAIPIHDAALVYDPRDPIAIDIATKNVADDFKKITGELPRRIAANASDIFSSHAPKTAIIAATVDSPLIWALEKRGLVNVSDIRGEWETFRTTVVRDYQSGKGALVIAGSDKRAVVYGLYTLSEQCGQSPYHWWADVPTTRHEAIYALPITTTHGSPSVKYRGLFINDEAPALTGWWSRKHGVDHYPLDTEFYRHVFDLILRLKGNFIWPAMWASYVPPPGNIFFTDDLDNQQLADDYGIVVSTSHHEPMQRATNEWNSSETGEWDWTTNKANVTRFMEEGVRRAGNNETYFTMGMRGASDSAISGEDPIDLLRDVIDTQRDILVKYHQDLSAVNQVWTIYKEVATYYAGGLNPPEDVTLMFTDDSWGNTMRLPTAEEAARPGGIGLYYHFEYVGNPKSYKWQNTNNLAKVYKELYQALERGVDRIWVFNVADIKPMELPLAFAMDIAWDSSRFGFGFIPEYLNAFASREFSSGPMSEEIASILLEHSRLIGRRKYESTTSITYSFKNYNELERVLGEWENLASRVLKVRHALSPEFHPAYFHLVQYPVQAGLLYHRIVLHQSTNQQYAIQRRNTANKIAKQILADSDADADLREEYNSMLDGKWDGIIDQPKLEQWQWERWLSPSRDIIQNLSFVQPRQNFVYALGNLGIYGEGSESANRQSFWCESCDPSMPTTGSSVAKLPVMDPYGPKYRTVELFHRGDHRTSIEFRLDIPYDWIKISPVEGRLTPDNPDQRLQVSIDWDRVPSGFNESVGIGVHYDTLPRYDNFIIPVQNRHALPPSFHGFPETAGYISIEAPHFQRASNGTGTVHFETLPYLGIHTESGTVALRPYRAARESATSAQAATLEYDIYLFNSTTKLSATIYLTQNLDTDPALPMQYSLTIDSQEANFTRLLTEPETAGDLPDTWTDEIENAVWTRKVDLGRAEAGVHTIKWRVNSPEVYLEKIVIDTGNAVRKSYLGPPETKLL
ncbi:hypothetical protein BJX63DRAFT_441466 [Aspergillus granulosus]|uniref:Gylcosyl hydrolase 115 C-terminal domain-containing protein n=1 Tax=Aspergillus granulosus TaxID=176169 RepID=A0ABR4HPS9_9EURO